MKIIARLIRFYHAIFHTQRVRDISHSKMALLRYALKGLLLLGIIHLSSAVLPPYVGNGLPNTFQRNYIINHYFSLDLA